MNKQDEARRKRLRRLGKGDDPVQVGCEDLRWLLDETGRLQQANDRLRRQNKRLRLRRGEAAAPGDAEEA